MISLKPSAIRNLSKSGEVNHLLRMISQSGLVSEVSKSTRSAVISPSKLLENDCFSGRLSNLFAAVAPIFRCSIACELLPSLAYNLAISKCSLAAPQPSGVTSPSYIILSISNAFLWQLQTVHPKYSRNLPITI